jgi:hypothetical protein
MDNVLDSHRGAVWKQLNGNKCLIAFRGTDAMEWSDWEANLQFKPKDHGETYKGGHSGFDDVARAMYSEIVQAKKSFRATSGNKGLW